MSEECCPHCGYAEPPWLDGHWTCDGCGCEWPPPSGPIEDRVAELFAEMFPPGGDGPPQGYDIGALYEQAAAELQDAIQRDIDRILGREVDGEG